MTTLLAGFGGVMMWVCILAGACMACVWVTLDEG